MNILSQAARHSPSPMKYGILCIVIVNKFVFDGIGYENCPNIQTLSYLGTTKLLGGKLVSLSWSIPLSIHLSGHKLGSLSGFTKINVKWSSTLCPIRAYVIDHLIYSLSIE